MAQLPSSRTTLQRDRAAIRATASERLRKEEVVTVLLWIGLSRKPRHIAGPTFTINGESAGLIELFGR
jgi:hypothetical protein